MQLIGIDLVDIARIEKFMARFKQKALAKFLDEDEIKLAQKPQTVAGFFATKEAVSKALGVGISKECGFKDIKIHKTSKNAPYFTLSKKIIDKYKIIDTTLSITHDKGLAIAVVVIEVEKKEKNPIYH